MADINENRPDSEDYGRGVSVRESGLLDQDALWEVVAAEHSHLDTEREVEEQTATDFEDDDPFVHLQCHVLVENQLYADEPPQVRKAVNALRQTGMDRHSAVHAVAAHAFALILAPMGANVVESERQYVDRLKQLIRHPEFAVEP